MARTITAAIFLCLATACGTATSPGLPLADLAGGDGGSTLCTPGAVQSCNCLGTGMGVQTCRANGASYGPCVACGTDGGGLSGDMAITTGGPCGDCDGCCNGSTCVAAASQDDNECGTRTTCAACTTGNTCMNGACTPTSAPVCTGCPYYGTLCQNGQCSTAIDPNAMFKMYVKDLLLDSTDNGSEWDPPENKAPDPFLCVSFTVNGQTKTGCNKYCDSVYDCTPASGDNLVGNSDGSTQATSPLYIPGSAFTTPSSITITVYDYDDFDANDLAGQTTFTTTSYNRPFFIPGFQSVGHIEFELD